MRSFDEIEREIEASVLTLDSENPIRLSADELRDEIRKVAVGEFGPDANVGTLVVGRQGHPYPFSVNITVECTCTVSGSRLPFIVDMNGVEDDGYVIDSVSILLD